MAAKKKTKDVKVRYGWSEGGDTIHGLGDNIQDVVMDASSGALFEGVVFVYEVRRIGRLSRPSATFIPDKA